MRPVIGTCQTIDHVGAGRAHLIAGVLGAVAVASLIGSALVELVLSRWHFGSHAYHEGEAAKERR